MARATSKKDLIESSNLQYDKLWDIINTMTEEEKLSTLDYGDFIGKEAHWKRDKNLRDVLIHLYEWHQLFLDWVNSNLKGKEKSFLPAPYNWRNYGQMNIKLWEKHQNTSLETSEEILRESHNDVMKLIDEFSNEELFMKKIYSWTGGSTLGSYAVSVTSSHYIWAIKKLKKSLKVLRNK
ncbi:ClbS/DfsB family four-helix bundle protein [Miniphocaeibacter halophilus]|uniref:ClbS/DfsB family four-helix bundle protein n=1 Tax=Miniphocaeibacter halophilus TaxID=2931922 RepID=A0AC61MPG5_9FIRM|nr:ClbS/DfsB family four-helix bundle protein [Miniphocaeibacter halophilus]QQK07407.1 ClbS/DfsB family four-helix bundle protein [Miniphocaeibacter halophilus]